MSMEYLSTDTSGTHKSIQTQKCLQNTSLEQITVPDQWKRIYKTTQTLVGTRGKNRSVSRTGPTLGGWGN